MRTLFAILALLLAVTPLQAQSQMPSDAPPGADDGRAAEAVPPLPGERAPESDNLGSDQTPPVQEDTIPRTPEEETVDPDAPPGEVLPGSPSQPGFNQDAVPQSTEPQREGSEESRVPEGTGDTEQATDIPAPATEGTQPGTPETVLPDQGEAETQPDVVPDRRFETFELELEGGTPEANPPQEESEEGGTRTLPPGGYGIGGGGPS